jgi:hypothetical protein
MLGYADNTTWFYNNCIKNPCWVTTITQHGFLIHISALALQLPKKSYDAIISSFKAQVVAVLQFLQGYTIAQHTFIVPKKTSAKLQTVGSSA